MWFIEEILAINPNLKIIAAPWTCPKWMKVTDINTKNPKDSWTDGHLNRIIARLIPSTSWSLSMWWRRKASISMLLVLRMSHWTRLTVLPLYALAGRGPFVKELAAQFKKNNLQTKIYVFDHNYNYDNIADQEDYPVKLTMLSVITLRAQSWFVECCLSWLWRQQQRVDWYPQPASRQGTDILGNQYRNLE